MTYAELVAQVDRQGYDIARLHRLRHQDQSYLPGAADK